MLYVLFVVTLFFLILNYMITRGDYLHPSTLFCEIFAVYELICIIGQSAYQITLHSETVFVMICGFMAFTIGGIISSKKKYVKDVNIPLKQQFQLEYIYVSNYFVYALIAIQIVTDIFFVKYLKAISAAWGSGGGSLSEMINLYDTMTKFWTTTFDKLNVPVPMAYRIGNPIATAGSWIILYIMVNNFMINKKIKLSHIVVILLMCISIQLNGSRSPLLRVITFVVIMIYMLNYKKFRYRKGSFKFFLRLIFVVLGVSVLMIAVLSLIGRLGSMPNVWRYIFIYTGAPIVNLDNFLTSQPIKIIGGNTVFFGEHTFYNGYAYLAKILKFSFADKVKKIGGFVFSDNGIEIGNVYTTYNVFAYDFGYLGVFPLIFIVALYYTVTYKKILRDTKSTKTIDFKFFIYAYIFNDLIMLPFSNRFYSTILDAPFIKTIVVAWIMKCILFDKKATIGKYRLKCKV